MKAARSLQIVAGLAGLVALTLGLAFWIAQINFISIHMLFGLIVTLSLLTLAIMALRIRELRVLGIVGVIYAPIVPLFGLTQEALLVGDLHWLIRTAHLLVGIGAIALAGIIAARYQRLKRPTNPPVRQPQAVH